MSQHKPDPTRHRYKMVHAHEQVAETAKEFAHELYDALMRDDVLYAEWKRQHPGVSSKRLEELFVKKNYSKCIPAARATLALMLSHPGTDPEVKVKIHEALVLDSSLVRGRAKPKLVMM
jgi:hypothetical protein